MPKKKPDKKVVKKAMPKADPKDAKIKKLRGVISRLCHMIDIQRDFQSKRKCHECDHFIVDAYNEAKKI